MVEWVLGTQSLSRPPASSVLRSCCPHAPRNMPGTLEEEEEEFQDPLREQDLKAAYVQLVRGMQEWQDGCVYRGHFGLDMKLGYGEFSWPTGEVTGFWCFLPSSPGAWPPGPISILRRGV